MSDAHNTVRATSAVTIWFDPVCPFSWHTARWLEHLVHTTGLTIDWQLMSLAVLNEGRELPPRPQARMHDSRQIGRLMTAISHKHGAADMAAGYFTFGERYFDGSEPVSDSLAAHILNTLGCHDITASVMSDGSQDALVRQSHQAGQDALGESGGSPILQLSGRTFFGPVLTGLPDPEVAGELFDAIAALAKVPQFTQLQRPRGAG